MTRTGDIDDVKAEARKAAYARRKDAFRSGDAAAGAARLLAALAPYRGRDISGYMPMRSEIDPLPAMADLALDGRIGVPVIPGKAVPLVFHLWTPQGEMRDGPFGARVPVNGVEMEPEVLIVPLLSFDRRGFRLGYGGGYYDRTLEALRARRPTVAVGFAWAAQEVEAVPVEPTDQRLDAVVTEAEIIEIGRQAWGVP